MLFSCQRLKKNPERYCSQLLLCRIAHVFFSVLFRSQQNNHSRTEVQLKNKFDFNNHITMSNGMTLIYALLCCFREKLWWTNFGTTVWNWKRGMVLIDIELFQIYVCQYYEIAIMKWHNSQHQMKCKTCTTNCSLI